MNDFGAALTVSVALCTFNSGPFLDAQLESILALDVPPTEIVLSDDASSDDTVARARGFVEKARAVGTQLTIIHGEASLGVTANFQRAIEACSGELIALCDHDDVWHSDRLTAAIGSFEEDPLLLLQHGDARLVDADGAPLGVDLLEALGVTDAEILAINSGHSFEVYLRRNLATGATTMFRRSLAEHAIPFPSSWVHDEWLAMLASALGRVEVLEHQLIDYRQHGSNQIGVTKPTFRYRVRRMLEPRGARNATLARRAADLVTRLEELGVDSELRYLARGKARFEAVRAALPANRLLRVRDVIREFRAGAYDTFASQGRLDVVRDLLQPHGENARG